MAAYRHWMLNLAIIVAFVVGVAPGTIALGESGKGSCDWLDNENATETPSWRELANKLASTLAATDGDWNQCIRCLFSATKTKLTYPAFKAAAQTLEAVKIGFAQTVFRPTLWLAKSLGRHGGPFFRAWVTLSHGEKADAIDKELHEAFEAGSFKLGHSYPTFVGEVKPAVGQSGGLVERIETLKNIKMSVGEKTGAKPFEISLGLHTSAVSFPSVSAQTKAIWITNHAVQARQGRRLMLNSGEGGPGFELAFLSGDRVTIRREIIEYGIKTGEFERASLDQAFVETQVDRIFKVRDYLMKEYNLKTSDMLKVQVVGQFGGGLNGIRDSKTGEINEAALQEVSSHEAYVMTQFKLGQAAKSRAQNSKITLIPAWLRKVSPNQPVSAPEKPPGFETPKGVAHWVKRTRKLTGKPVSLKIIVGDPVQFRDWIEGLVKEGGLPDHFQIDGVPSKESGGSGNMARGQSGSIDTVMAGAIVHGNLMRLGVRQNVILEGSGGVRLAEDGTKLIGTYYDLFSSARTWMVGANCKKMRRCNSGECLYGTAASSFSMFANAMPLKAISKKSINFVNGWHDILYENMALTGAETWVGFWQKEGLYNHTPHLNMRVDHSDTGLLPMVDSFQVDRMHKIMRKTFTRKEIVDYYFGGRDPGDLGD